MKYPNDTHFCPLLKETIYYGSIGGCYEIQEVRENEMDEELLPFSLDKDAANKICEKCKWYRDLPNTTTEEMYLIMDDTMNSGKTIDSKNEEEKKFYSALLEKYKKEYGI